MTQERKVIIAQQDFQENPPKEGTTFTHEKIHDLAIRAAAGTLKRIHDASGNDTIRKLRNNLQADINHLKNAEYLQSVNDKKKYTISDAYDLVTVAYDYLYDRMVNAGLNEQDTETRTLKIGTKKERTIFQWACVEVRRAVYAEKSIENNGKYTYIEDMRGTDESAENALDRHYIRMGKYYDMGGSIGNGDISSGLDGIYTADQESYEKTREIIHALKLTDRQLLIIKYRMQGINLEAIAEKLDVKPQTLNKQLDRIREKVKELFPEMIRAFNLNKHSR